jgi:hypothetical protein
VGRSEAYKIAKLEADTAIISQVIGLATDPLWSTIGGFVAIHELRRQDMIGPVADDVLYAGVIAINTARQPAMMELAGKGISAAASAAGAAGGVVGAYAVGKVGQKLLSSGRGEASFSKALTLASKGGETLTILPPGSMPQETSAKGYAAAVREGNWWQIWRAFA